MQTTRSGRPEVAPYLQSWSDVLRQLGRRQEARELQAKARALFATGSAAGPSLVDVSQLQPKPHR